METDTTFKYVGGLTEGWSVSPTLPCQDSSVPAVGSVVEVIECTSCMVSSCEIVALIQSPVVALWPPTGNPS